MDAHQATLLKKHVIVALDLETMEEALRLADTIHGLIDKVKIGSHLFTACGPSVLDALHKRGFRIFLDLKFHDIPSVVESACRQAAAHEGVFLMTIHASGGPRMVAGACAGARTRDTPLPPAVIAVTALTSMGPLEMQLAGVVGNLEDYAEKLALMATEQGADGVVCSPQEVERLKRVLPEDTIFVTPGIRPESAQRASDDDQFRVMTPAEALAVGSSFLVVGRPVYKAADPLEALEKIGSSL